MSFDEKVKKSDIWQVPLFLLFLACYAELGNTLVPGSNYLFLRENGLPFNLFNAHFYLTYLVLLVVITIVVVLAMELPSIKKNRDNKKFRRSVRQNLELL